MGTEFGRCPRYPDVAAARNLQPGAHAVAVDLRQQRHITAQHGLQRAPDFHFMKCAQGRLVKAERRIFGNVATGAEMPAFAGNDHRAQIAPRGQIFKYRFEFTPHGARHGIEFACMDNGYARQRPRFFKLDMSGHWRSICNKTDKKCFITRQHASSIQHSEVRGRDATGHRYGA